MEGQRPNFQGLWGIDEPTSTPHAVSTARETALSSGLTSRSKQHVFYKFFQGTTSTCCFAHRGFVN